MDSAQFLIKWSTFNKDIPNGFFELLCAGELLDVTLMTEGRQIGAHRTVLSICSSYFRKEFNKMPINQYAVVVLKDVRYSVLQDLILFMYCGEVAMREDDLPAFFSTAERFSIKGLTGPSPQGPPMEQTASPGLSKPSGFLDEEIKNKPQLKPPQQPHQNYQKMQAIDKKKSKATYAIVARQDADHQTHPQQQVSFGNTNLSTKKQLRNSEPKSTKDPCAVISENQNPGTPVVEDDPSAVSRNATNSHTENAEGIGEVAMKNQLIQKMIHMLIVLMSNTVVPKANLVMDKQ